MKKQHLSWGQSSMCVGISAPETSQDIIMSDECGLDMRPPHAEALELLKRGPIHTLIWKYWFLALVTQVFTADAYCKWFREMLLEVLSLYLRKPPLAFKNVWITKGMSLRFLLFISFFTAVPFYHRFTTILIVFCPELWTWRYCHKRRCILISVSQDVSWYSLVTRTQPWTPELLILCSVWDLSLLYRFTMNPVNTNGSIYHCESLQLTTTKRSEDSLFLHLPNWYICVKQSGWKVNYNRNGPKRRLFLM